MLDAKIFLKAVDELEEKGIYIDLFKANVSKRSEVQKLVNFAIEKYN